MMLIDFAPVRGATDYALAMRGDTLRINGAPLDLSALPEGGELPADAIRCDLIAGPVTRDADGLRITLVLPCTATDPEARRFPAPVEVALDGPIAVPPAAGERAPHSVPELIEVDWSRMLTADALLELQATWQTAEAAIAHVSAMLDAAVAPLMAGIPAAEVRSWGVKVPAARAYLDGTAPQEHRDMIETEAQVAGRDPMELCERILARSAPYMQASAIVSGIRQRAGERLAEASTAVGRDAVVAEIAAMVADRLGGLEEGQGA